MQQFYPEVVLTETDYLGNRCHIPHNDYEVSAYGRHPQTKQVAKTAYANERAANGTAMTYDANGYRTKPRLNGELSDQ